MRVFLLVALASLHAAPAAAAQLKTHGNPIRKVVKMLQLMQKKIKVEGKKQEDLFDKYMCYCKETALELDKSIAVSKDRIPQITSSLKEAKAMHQQLTEDVKEHQSDRKEAEETLSTAMAIRLKEENSFARDAADMKANVNALSKAVAAVDKGTADFLQTQAASAVRSLTMSMDMNTVDREMLTSFLSQRDRTGDDAAYSPQSGEILGILKQLHETMSQELAQGHAQDEASKANHESLVKAKRKEIDAATKSIEEKMGRIGDLAVEKTSLANDLEDTQEGLEEDTKFLAELQTACSHKKSAWESYQKTMSEEKMALAETIKLLNDDEAQDLFKKTLPSAPTSFLQLSEPTKTPERKAIALLRRGGRKDHRMSFLILALRGKQEGFDEVKKMIDDLVALLKEEQTGDNNKKDYCENEMDRLEDQIKTAKRAISDINSNQAAEKDLLQEVETQIEAMKSGITELDKQVAVATKSRKEEKKESLEVLAENNAAKSLLELAKNRLHKFYNPKLYKKEEKTKIDVEQDAIAEGFGAEVLVQAPPEMKEGPDLGYKKKGQQAGGVLAMIDLLRSDLLQQSTEIETNEKRAEEDYQEFLKNSADKRAMDSKAITDKESARAEHEATLHQLKIDMKVQEENQKSSEKEHYILHKDCDWLLQKYDLRKEARNDEIDSLKKAKAVLSGANYN